ncbi:MAG: 50S ribosomal protein L9, partial [Clostridia bacterium]|nr:50S ribosomal protein L9 [Clostridia bacterium]
EKKAAKALAEQLSSVVVKIRSASGTDGKLYGAVTSKDIAEHLEKDFGIVVDKRKIDLEENIKNYGTYSVSVKLYTDIVAKFTVVVHE